MKKMFLLLLFPLMAGFFNLAISQGPRPVICESLNQLELLRKLGINAGAIETRVSRVNVHYGMEDKNSHGVYTLDVGVYDEVEDAIQHLPDERLFAVVPDEINQYIDGKLIVFSYQDNKNGTYWIRVRNVVLKIRWRSDNPLQDEAISEFTLKVMELIRNDRLVTPLVDSNQETHARYKQQHQFKFVPRDRNSEFARFYVPEDNIITITRDGKPLPDDSVVYLTYDAGGELFRSFTIARDLGIKYILPRIPINEAEEFKITVILPNNKIETRKFTVKKYVAPVL